VVKAGTYVQIRVNILEAGERAAGIPLDTAATPLVMWVKGWLLHDVVAVGGNSPACGGTIPAVVQIRTATGRVERGMLEEVEPVTKLGYGDFVPEVMEIAKAVRSL